MSEELLVRHCSPTLAGIKTGSLFSCAYQTKEQLMEEINRINRKMVPKGLRVLPLRAEEGRALIYVYRPHALTLDLMDEQARKILKENGYTPERSGQCVLRLIQRLREKGDFPHEIGLFLSYPPEDVLGFIENGACNHKCVGCWKVYGDPDAAQALFEKYRACTKIYMAQWNQGKTIERLAVAG